MIGRTTPIIADKPATIAAFEAVHGPGIRHRGHIWFADGARCLDDPYGILAGMDIEPRDDGERAERIVVYHRAALDRAVQRFDRRKGELMNDPDAHNDDGSALAEMKQLRDAVHDAKAALAEAEEVLRRINPRYRTPAERAAIDAAVNENKARDMAARDEFRRAVNALEI